MRRLRDASREDCDGGGSKDSVPEVREPQADHAAFRVQRLNEVWLERQRIRR